MELFENTARRSRTEILDFLRHRQERNNEAIAEVLEAEKFMAIPPHRRSSPAGRRRTVWAINVLRNKHIVLRNGAVLKEAIEERNRG